MKEKVGQLIASTSKIVIIQADNPDADSLGSALALEQILGKMGKDVALYCGVDMPSYLRYLSGWDRVVRDLPVKFDLSIVVDASTLTLLEQLQKSGELALVKSKPCVVLDHHAITDNKLDFASVEIINPEVASTGELIYNIATELGWSLDSTSGECLMASILGDTQGLTNDLAKASTYRVMASLFELGVNRPKLEEARRLESKMVEKIYRYKGELISRTELSHDNQIASVVIPQQEINDYSPLYNPAALVTFDMLSIENVALAIVFKHYDSGRVTAAIRSNYDYPIAGQLAEAMGGGGHSHAAGFRIEQTNDFAKIKSDCITHTAKLLAKLKS